ncbi:MAG TPA: nuclear transport factor 2 family protein [Membranihabitans sp.]|nr:nuclear transport factor 2 family protein [Membranihabitans sp.]
MKVWIIGLILMATTAHSHFAQTPNSEESDIMMLSMKKWEWMSDKNVKKMDTLFHEQSVFVHMGGSWGKQQELDVIASGGIWYKKADVHERSVQIIGPTAILLNRIDLLAEVGGNEVTNPFIVTEVYVKKNEQWKLGSLSFTRVFSPSDR